MLECKYGVEEQNSHEFCWFWKDCSVTGKGNENWNTWIGLRNHIDEMDKIENDNDRFEILSIWLRHSMVYIDE